MCSNLNSLHEGGGGKHTKRSRLGAVRGVSLTFCICVHITWWKTALKHTQGCKRKAPLTSYIWMENLQEQYQCGFGGFVSCLFFFKKKCSWAKIHSVRELLVKGLARDSVSDSIFQQKCFQCFRICCLCGDLTKNTSGDDIKLNY